MSFVLNLSLMVNSTLTWSCRHAENTLWHATCVPIMRVWVIFPAVVTWISRRSGETPPCITAACTKSQSASSYSWGASQPPTSVSHTPGFFSLTPSAPVHHSLTVDYASSRFSQSERRNGSGCCQATEEHSVWGGSKYSTAQSELAHITADNQWWTKKRKKKKYKFKEKPHVVKLLLCLIRCVLLAVIAVIGYIN